MTDWQPLLTLLEQKQADLPLKEDERAAYVANIKATIEKAELRENDNKRAATLIAVDAAKTFVTIAIALVVAIVGFLQFTYRNVHWLILLALAASALLAFVSMVSGFQVISLAYKRADGRVEGEKATEDSQGIGAAAARWSTEYLRGPIDRQAWTGVGALALFAVALASFNIGAIPPKRFVITLPDGTTSVRTATTPLSIGGTWSSLRVEQSAAFRVTLPPVPANQQRSVRIDVR